MADQGRSQSPGRSSLPPPLHRHLRSAPQLSHGMPITTGYTPAPPWTSGQRSTTDPAYYTYPPPSNASRESSLPPPENQQAETTHGWQISVPQPDVPFWDERFPHPQRIGHAESYTRADDSSWGGSYASSHRAQPSDWRTVPFEQFEGHPRLSSDAEILRSQRALAEPSSSRFSFVPYVAMPEELSERVYDERPNLTTSVTNEPAHDQAYLQSTTPQGLPGISSAEDFVSPLFGSVLLDLPAPTITIDGSSSEAGQGDVIEESPTRIVTARKGKRRVSGAPEEALPALRKFRKKTEIACNFCRGRKLGCSGDRPKCTTCLKQGRECMYEATARRRGPGKAPRGSRKVTKGREVGSRTQRSTPEGSQSIFPGTGFEVPLPRIQVPGSDDFDPSPANGEEGQDHPWRVNSVDRAFLNSFSSPGWGTVT